MSQIPRSVPTFLPPWGEWVYLLPQVNKHLALIFPLLTFNMFASCLDREHPGLNKVMQQADALTVLCVSFL